MRVDYEILARNIEVKFSPMWLEANIETRIVRTQQRQLEQGNSSAVSKEWVEEVMAQGDVTWPLVDASGTIESILEKVQGIVNNG